MISNELIQGWYSNDAWEFSRAYYVDENYNGWGMQFRFA